MGADLIGWHAKGPASLTVSDEQQEHIIDQLVRVASWWRGLPAGVRDGEDDDQLRAAMRNCPLPIDLEMLDDDAADIRDVMGWLEQDDDGRPVDDLREHVTAWTTHLLENWPPAFRDSSFIADPDDPQQLLVFAGELSWGDEPAGVGFSTLKKLALTGIGAVVGIKCLSGYFTLTLGN